MVAVLELFVLYWGPITTQRRKSQSMLAGLVHELTGCSAALGLKVGRLFALVNLLLNFLSFLIFRNSFDNIF
jgi:hypothetical protein